MYSYNTRVVAKLAIIDSTFLVSDEVVGRRFSLTLFRMGIFGAAHGWGRGQKVNNDETWYSYTLPKEDPKNI